MKLISSRLVLLLVLCTCSYAMCSKKDATANPPLLNIPNKGFLCTMGINSIDVLDTLCMRNSSSGRWANMTDYSSTAEAGGFIKRPRDFYELINTGANQYHIKVSGGEYLGYKFNQYSTDYNRYSFTMDPSPSDNNLFLIEQTGNKFTIRPVANPNVYLSTMASNVQPPDPAHRTLRFLENNPQPWWFMQ